MQAIYKGMWALIAVVIFIVVDLRLPAHGFGWVQATEWWQVLRMGVMYALLPYLGLRLFEIIVVGKNHGQVGEITTLVANIQQLQDDLQQVQHQLTTTHQQQLPPPQQEEQEQQPLLPSPQQERLLVDDLPSWDIGNLTPAQGNPVPETDLDHDLSQAVMLYAQWGSYAKAATRLGGKITGEGMRQRVVSAYQKDPQWVMKVLPYDKLPKV